MARPPCHGTRRATKAPPALSWHRLFNLASSPRSPQCHAAVIASTSAEAMTLAARLGRPHIGASDVHHSWQVGDLPPCDND